jgi:hypothetical protein
MCLIRWNYPEGRQRLTNRRGVPHVQSVRAKYSYRVNSPGYGIYIFLQLHIETDVLPEFFFDFAVYPAS